MSKDTRVALERIQFSNQPALERLLQLHLYEIGMDPGADGLIDWGEALDPFLSDPTFLALHFLIGEQVVGFALAKLDRHPTGPDGKTPMEANVLEEFHILRPYRRKGIGACAADLMFGQYPGRWIVTCHPDPIRVAFWRHVALGPLNVDGVERAPGKHRGYPGQYVWVVESGRRL